MGLEEVGAGGGREAGQAQGEVPGEVPRPNSGRRSGAGAAPGSGCGAEARGKRDRQALSQDRGRRGGQEAGASRDSGAG